VEAIVGAAGWTIRGSTGPVWAAQSATLLLVSAKTPAGIGILIVDPTLSSVDISSYRTFDDGKASTITFSDCPAIPLNNMDIDQSEAVSHAECVTRIAYARHTVGVMEAALSLTVDYLKTRQQFGVPLRTFQNLTFRAADMYAAVELTRSMATWASMVLDEEPGRAHEASARSGALACRTARLIAEESVQLHGGIGITAEAPIAHHASRLLALQALMGGRPDNVDRLASTLEDSDRAELLRAPTELR
jgi:alkylation response protein AidB-like acyl-CoA dehydrogenase